MITVGTLSKSCSRMAGPMSIGAAVSVNRGVPRRLRVGFDPVDRPGLRLHPPDFDLARQAQQAVVGRDEILLLAFLAELAAGCLELASQGLQVGAQVVGDDAWLAHAAVF